jgi:hypothetical protein
MGSTGYHGHSCPSVKPPRLDHGGDELGGRSLPDKNGDQSPSSADREEFSTAQVAAGSVVYRQDQAPGRLLRLSRW